MANISTLLNTIKNAIYGRDMRSALHDSIESVNDDVETRLSRSGGTVTGDIIMNDHKVTSSAVPSADDDYANKKYVDDSIGSIHNVTDVKINGKSVVTDGMANISYANAAEAGVIKVMKNWGFDILNGFIKISSATDSDIDNHTNSYNPIVPSNLHYAVRSVYPIVKDSLDSPTTTTLNTIYNVGVQSTMVITLPAAGQLGSFMQVDFISGTTPTTLYVTSSAGILGFDLIPEANMVYSLYFDWGIISSSGSYGWRCAYSEYDISIIGG